MGNHTGVLFFSMSLRNTSLMEGILSFVTLGQSETGSCGQWKIDYKKKQV